MHSWLAGAQMIHDFRSRGMTLVQIFAAIRCSTSAPKVVAAMNEDTGVSDSV